MPEVRRVDDWELRCRFNHGRYPERLQAGEFTEQRYPIGTPDPSVGLPVGSVSEDVYYYDAKTNNEVLRYHQYTLPDGSIGASGKRDPKRIRIGDVWFRQKRGPDDSARDPCLLFPKRGYWRLLYGTFRRLCCFVLGPEIDSRLADLLTPFLRHVLTWG
jgi:hypothetical protein